MYAGHIIQGNTNTRLQSMVLIGHYDLWVKRGVVSLMGAKLHPSPRVYRVYAPSTHSLPVIKCVSGVDGAAEVEFKSCHSGIYRLRDLSHLYQRIWNGANTPADKLSLKQQEQSTRRTFSVVRSDYDNRSENYSLTIIAPHIGRRPPETPSAATAPGETVERGYQNPISTRRPSPGPRLRP
jgi:hypothetical protein